MISQTAQIHPKLKAEFLLQRYRKPICHACSGLPFQFTTGVIDAILGSARIEKRGRHFPRDVLSKSITPKIVSVITCHNLNVCRWCWVCNCPRVSLPEIRYVTPHLMRAQHWRWAPAMNLDGCDDKGNYGWSPSTSARPNGCLLPKWVSRFMVLNN